MKLRASQARALVVCKTAGTGYECEVEGMKARYRASACEGRERMVGIQEKDMQICKQCRITAESVERSDAGSGSSANEWKARQSCTVRLFLLGFGSAVFHPIQVAGFDKILGVLRRDAVA